MSRRLPLALVVLVLVSWTAPAASASPPVAYGKVVQAGAFGVPFGQGSFPGQDLFSDGDLVYDTQLSIEVVNANPVPVSFNVSVETWTPGTITITQNTSGPNGSYTLRQVTVPARLDPKWSNGSMSIPGAPTGGSSSQFLSLSLPAQSSESPMELKVGHAAWELQLLTPVTNSLAAINAAYGIQVVGLVVAVYTTLVLAAALWFAGHVGRRVFRTPRVRIWWPVGWVAVPVLLFIFDYVPANQILGGASSFVLPGVIAVAGLPYMIRRAARGSEVYEFEGVDALNTEEAANPKALLPVVKGQAAVRCAPETWREVLYTLWGVPLPEIRGAEISVLGRKIRVQPRGMLVTSPLGAGYASEAERSCWYDSRSPIKRTNHRLAWTRSETVAWKGPVQPGTPTPIKTRRRFSPHIVPGYLEVTSPPKKPVAMVLANVYSAEQMAHDNEKDRLAFAEIMGRMDHLARERSDRDLARMVRAHQVGEDTRTESENEQRTEGSRRRNNGDRAGGTAPDQP